jgi:hypothetical protein|nr:MAG TPA: hypothetical protein [Caudoviricetes sp.]
MRRCKYFYRETWLCDNYIPCSGILCTRYQLPYVKIEDCKIGLNPCYTPVEVDPYWKDIIDETNRRLNLKK